MWVVYLESGRGEPCPPQTAGEAQGVLGPALTIASLI